jgi:hypothetical protein
MTSLRGNALQAGQRRPLIQLPHRLLNQDIHDVRSWRICPSTPRAERPSPSESGQ